MAQVNVSGTESTKRLRTIKRGRLFRKNSNAYILAVHSTKDGTHLAALVNLSTGDSIHRLKEVANAKIITKDELTTLNFKSDPATMVE